MFNIGGGEMVVLAVLALLVFGPEGLPDIVRTVTRTLRAFRTAASDFQQEFQSALDTESQQRRVTERRRRKVAVETRSEDGEREPGSSKPPQESVVEESSDTTSSETGEFEPTVSSPEAGAPAAGDSPPPLVVEAQDADPPLGPSNTKIEPTSPHLEPAAETTTGVVGQESPEASTEPPAEDRSMLLSGDATPPALPEGEEDDDGPGRPMSRLPRSQPASVIEEPATDSVPADLEVV